MSTLAIFTPKIGERSETFIRRHIEELAPGRVVVVTLEKLPEADRTWDVSCPALVLRDLSFERVRYSRHVQRIVPASWAQRYYAARISPFLRRHRVNAMLGQYLHQSWPFLAIARQKGIRFFAHAHGYDLSKYWRQGRWRSRYRDYADADGVIVVNRVMQERMLSAGVPPEKLHIVPYGVDVPDRMERVDDSRPCRFLAVGRMVEKKAPLKTLEAFRMALRERPEIRLEVVGTGPLFPAVQAKVEQLGLQSAVQLHGGQAHDFVLGRMRTCHCFVQHSIVSPTTFDEEGVPVAILEAMAHGLPVISTLHAGIPEAVESSRSGILVEEGDVEGMARAMVTLATDRDLRERMRQHARATALARFTWKTERGELTRILGLDQEVQDSVRESKQVVISNEL